MEPDMLGSFKIPDLTSVFAYCSMFIFESIFHLLLYDEQVIDKICG